MTKKRLVLGLGMTLVLAAGAVGAGELDTRQQRYSYTMGAKLGVLLKSQGVRALDAAAFSRGIDDVINGRTPRLDQEQMNAAITEQQELDRRERQDEAARNQAAGAAYLAQNAQRDGVVVLENGVQYRVIEPGHGASPKAGDKVRVHYRGTLIDGREFDSSYQRGKPAEFGLDGVIPGFREALTRMRPGAHWEVVIPSALAYGTRGVGGDIGPNSTLKFELELLAIL